MIFTFLNNHESAVTKVLMILSDRLPSSYSLFNSNFGFTFNSKTLTFTHPFRDNEYPQREIFNEAPIKEHPKISGLWTTLVPSKNNINLKKVCSQLFANFSRPSNYSKNRNHRMSDVIELGVSLLSLESAEPKYIFYDSCVFGSVTEIYRFISWEMARVDGRIPKRDNPEMNEIMDNIQITIRRYKIGQGIGPHIDRPDKFTDRIFTVVVEANLDKGLIFTREDGQMYQVPEVDGQLQIQTGDSRYKFTHKLDSIKYGHRISITWRFFREDFLSRWRPTSLRKKNPVIEKLKRKINFYQHQNFSFFKNDWNWF